MAVLQFFILSSEDKWREEKRKQCDEKKTILKLNSPANEEKKQKERKKRRERKREARKNNIKTLYTLLKKMIYIQPACELERKNGEEESERERKRGEEKNYIHYLFQHLTVQCFEKQRERPPGQPSTYTP